ncbi:MAG: flavin-containing monooxygenase [Solirubrobacteraceae bacterium]
MAQARTQDGTTAGDRVDDTGPDVVVVGAGFTGLYALHRLRQAGLSVVVLDAAPEIGGTWYWNGYPGARCDVESADYSYSFSPELDQEWEWSERYAAQPEILRYINHVADRFRLRPHIRLGVRVTAASFDEDDSTWTLTCDSGETLSARFCVFATGGLSAPLRPGFPGVDAFRGESYMTSLWPRDGVDLRGKRVAVIGTGSSGLQVVPEIADEAAHVTVLQRTPNYSVLGGNRPLTRDDLREIRQTYPERRRAQRTGYTGLSLRANPRRAAEMTEEERRTELESRWEEGGALLFTVAFKDVLTDPEANRVVADFIRERIRERTGDPRLADVVCPTDHPFAARRPCADHGFYEALSRDDVELVDVRSDPISQITETGIRLASGADHDVDVIVYALGYDAVTGAMSRIDIVGRDGVALADAWAAGPDNYLGLGVAGFPNMFMIGGPGSPVAMMIALGERQADWIATCITELDRRGAASIEATPDAQARWVDHIDELMRRTIYSQARDTYYFGANVPGKALRFPLYLGGLAHYEQLCEQSAADGYAGFRVSSPVSSVGEVAR